jgi:hypothetical protein
MANPTLIITFVIGLLSFGRDLAQAAPATMIYNSFGSLSVSEAISSVNA